MNSKQPYVRFFISDWLGGTRGMRAVEIGVYITLIALMYDRQAPLENDPRRLARQCGCTPKTFSQTLQLLIDEGKIEETPDGLWNKRVEKEFKWRAENSHNARAAAEKRWGKDNNINEHDMRTQCNGNAGAMPFQNPESESDSLAKARQTRARNDEFHSLFWPSYPHKVGKAAALKAWHKARERAEARDIVSGVRRYVSAKPPDRPWCNPATFLNQDRWLDEPGPDPVQNRSQAPPNAKEARRKAAIAETRGDLG